MQTLSSLPIDRIKDQFIAALKNVSNIILKASPGSGKTTRVPFYLLDESSLENKKIYILEPRRLAAKLAALQVARTLNEPIGQTVGYIFRYEKVVSEKTRIFFLTEGTFLKILSQNKNLDDVGIIILDEFHERHLSTDAALSFVMKLQKEARSDLKIVVMSATIETENLQLYLEKSASTTTLELEAQRFPLELSYLPNTTSIIGAPLSKKIKNAVDFVLENDLAGDMLIFLPGMREIKEAQTALFSSCEHFEVDCLILHGDLDSMEQDRVLMPSRHRKIILSTNIAESSVTIEGIRIVIDSGLQRESSYNFYSGLPELKITKISRASATQRAGRANRQGKGHCFRLYAELDYEQRPYLHRPEILKSDLSELYLMGLSLFQSPLEELPWFENPPAEALKNARELLTAINAVDHQEITSTGMRILQYPLHPRLGRILTEAEAFNKASYVETVSFIAEFSGEKNRDRLNKSLPAPKILNTKSIALEKCILSGFPDRIARARGEKFFDIVTKNGETLKIAREISQDFDPSHSLWVVLDLNNKGEVRKIIAIDELWLYDLVPFPIEEEIHFEWDAKKEQVMKFERTFVGKIILSESRSAPGVLTPEARALLIELARNYLSTLNHSNEYERLMTLNKIHHNLDPEIDCHEMLSAFFSQQNHFNQEDKILLKEQYFSELKKTLDPEGQYVMDSDFPMSIQLSDRRKIPIVYDRSQNPTIESLIQDFYGLCKTPILARGKIPLTLKLLGPHKLAIQVTQDLESFWNKTYPQIVVGLKRDYPRHYWPEDPKNARPILLKRQVPQ